MPETIICPLFRRPEGLGMGKGLGYCDMDGGGTTCEGDIDFCDKRDALNQYLRSKSEEVENLKR